MFVNKDFAVWIGFELNAEIIEALYMSLDGGSVYKTDRNGCLLSTNMVEELILNINTSLMLRHWNLLICRYVRPLMRLFEVLFKTLGMHLSGRVLGLWLFLLI